MTTFPLRPDRLAAGLLLVFLSGCMAAMSTLPTVTGSGVAQTEARTVADFTFYEVFGLFRLAVIVQQIYYRYAHKQTRNPAFRHFWIAVNYLDRRCRRLIRQS